MVGLLWVRKTLPKYLLNTSFSPNVFNVNKPKEKKRKKEREETKSTDDEEIDKTEEEKVNIPSRRSKRRFFNILKTLSRSGP